MPVSLCMIVKNEEKWLPGCLRSVQGAADEIIVVDTGSTDGTVKVAESFGAKVCGFRWNDSFSEARNFSLSRATEDWILVMDADDVFEREDLQKLLFITRGGEADAYCGRTFCYSGKTPESGGVLLNMNVRLFRNHRGFCYRGRIHEQLVRMENGRAVPFRMVATDIRFHHYGYLSSCIEAKGKHARNIALIGKELEEHPGDPFMLFNLGNEYFAMKEIEKAFGLYRKSLEKTDFSQGYAPVLLMRIVMCCDLLHRDGELFRFVKLGLRRYPRMTDFEFLRGNALLRQKKTAAAVRSYLRCVRMGEPPVDSNSVLGVGTFRPELALAGAYERLGENDKALRHCLKALGYNPKLSEAAGKAADLLIKKGRSFASIRKRLRKLVPENVSSCLMLSDVFYRRGAFGEAFRLAARAESLDPENPRARWREGMCKFRLGKYARAHSLFGGLPEGSMRENAGWMRFFCAELAPKSAGLRRGSLGELTGPRLEVAQSCRNLVKGVPCGILSDTAEGSAPYIGPIFDLLEVLLTAGRFSEFRKSLGLLNLISDDGVLLLLGKLYYRHGYAKLAYHELERSIRLTGKMDAEGLGIMKNTIASAG